MTKQDKDGKSKVAKMHAGGFEININDYLSDMDPLEILEKMYLIKHDRTLTDEEKRIKVQEIMKEFLR
ncbi:MAG: hypothetical protein AB1420_07050 [Bacillota bacterium]